MTLADRVHAVRERIARAADRARRDPETVGLVAVSKRKPAADVREALDAGVACFGENYVQELVDKADEVDGPEWHFVGHLQRNKINALLTVDGLTVLHGVDSVRLVEALERRLVRRVDVLVHVDVAEQDTKSGVTVEELPEVVAAARACEHLRLRGLMTMPPPTDDAEGARPFFRRLREVAERHDLEELSMGMTHDFEVAIEEGATFIRVGTAIFGPRP